MSGTGLLVFACVLAIAAAAGLSVLRQRMEGGGSVARFRSKPLLTANELEFLGRLEGAVPELRFCPQVAMGALLIPGVPRSDRREFYRLRGMFSQKIVDFVAQRRADGAIVAVIELDDRTHEKEKDVRRDEMMRSAGLKIVRWNSKTKPDAAAIRAALLPPQVPPDAQPQ
jgi:hypothetical protein